MREETFALTYCMKGITWGCIEEMPSAEREFHLARLYKQLKYEDEQAKKAAKKRR